MVAPLDVNRRMLHEEVDDSVRTVAAIKEVADDMNALDCEPLDEYAERVNEVRTAADLHDGLDQLFIVVELRLIQFGARTQQLHDDGFVAFWNVAAHLACREFPAHEFGQFEQICNVLLIPDCVRLALCCQLLHLLARIVDQRAELRLLLLRHALAEAVVHLFLDDTRAVVEDVKERIICTMQIAHEVLRALRQHELRFQIDDLLVDDLLRRVLLRHQTEHLVLLHLSRVYAHIASSCEIFLLFCILTSERRNFKESIKQEIGTKKGCCTQLENFVQQPLRFTLKQFISRAEIPPRPRAVPSPRSRQRSSSLPSPRP